MHLSDEEPEDAHQRRGRNSRSRSSSSSSSKSSEAFVPSVRPVPGDITFAQPSAKRRPSTGESPQPPDYTYAEVIKPSTSGVTRQQTNLRQTWHPDGIGLEQSPLAKTWHPNKVIESNQADLRTTMSERIEQIVESGKKRDHVGFPVDEEPIAFTGYPSRQSVRPSDETRYNLSATMQDPRPSDDQMYSRVIPKGSRRSPSPIRRSQSPQASSHYDRFQRSGASKLTRTTVDPTNGELHPYSRGVSRMAQSQRDGPAPFSYIPIDEIEKIRQRLPSYNSKPDDEPSSHYSKAIPRVQQSSRSERDRDYINLGRSTKQTTPQYSSGIPQAPPLPF